MQERCVFMYILLLLLSVLCPWRIRQHTRGGALRRKNAVFAEFYAVILFDDDTCFKTLR